MSAVAKQRWADVRVLLIDEVSMIDSELFQKLSEIGADVRNKAQAFGGLQIVACGDFFQLPPVGIGNYGKSFAFASPAWRDVGMRTCALTEVVRQSGDQEMVCILNEMREGHLSAKGWATPRLRACAARRGAVVCARKVRVHTQAPLRRPAGQGQRALAKGVNHRAGGRRKRECGSERARHGLRPRIAQRPRMVLCKGRAA